MKLVAIIGGIGTGKSVVSRLLRVMGYRVYDSDSEAKRLMNEDPTLRKQLAGIFGDDIYGSDGRLNNAVLAGKVFGDPQALSQLNALVHPAVAHDILRVKRVESDELRFVETALLRTAALEPLFDGIWRVVAPEEIRIARVMQRNGCTREQVRQRIAAQAIEESPFQGEQIIVNDGVTPIIPQVIELLLK